MLANTLSACNSLKGAIISSECDCGFLHTVAETLLMGKTCHTSTFHEQTMNDSQNGENTGSKNIQTVCISPCKPNVGLPYQYMYYSVHCTLQSCEQYSDHPLITNIHFIRGLAQRYTK